MSTCKECNQDFGHLEGCSQVPATRAFEKQTKHTPGPWFLSVPFHSQYAKSKLIQIGNARVCEIATARFNNEEQQANARLIKVAPELFQSACYFDYAYNEADNDTIESLDDDEIIEIRVTAKALKDNRTAIAKAKGEV